MIRVAIDGPAGVGKSSTSREIARRFGFAYLDTGAMYRVATWWCLHNGIDLHDQQAVIEAVLECFSEHIVCTVNPDKAKVFCDNQDVSDVIRGDDIAQHVALVSKIPQVREILITAQRAYINNEYAEDSFSHGRGIVVEGRDITTVVAPESEVRILLTAREEVRQARRAAQNGKHTQDNVATRDAADSKVTNFTEAAEGVTVIDNSDLSFEETVLAVADCISKALDFNAYESFTTSMGEYEFTDEDRALFADYQDDSYDTEENRQAVGVLAVVGRPNVGKSTLVNRILRRRAAVVEDKPGVTRDRVSYEAEWAGTQFLLVDTGGWEADVEGIDSAIASQAQIAVQLADAVVLVVDAHTGLTASDERIVSMLRGCGKPVTVAVNKIDDPQSEYMAAEFWKLGLGEPFPISAVHGRGVGDLLDEAINKLNQAEKTSGLLQPSNLNRVALVGRPNVGKSSLLNQLAHQERSVVHDMAGTTRDPVDEVVTIDGKDWLFIDTAGIKRRLHKVSGADYYSSLRTQAALERAELALVLFDVSVPIAEQDLRVMSQAVDAGRAIVLVFNKWDLLDDFGRQRIERLYATEFERVTWASRVNLSAKTGWHTNRLSRAMNQALESWHKRIPTGRLNAFLGQLQQAHPHPLRGGKQPRILFATQASACPPRFVIFATGFLDHGYRRYIERSLREEFGFEGSPIQISVNIREKKKH